MKQVATFTFHGALQAFLRPAARQKPVQYTFSGAPAVKDAIEAIGVPHTEVAVILRENVPIGFTERLCQEDQLDVYPIEAERDWPEGYTLVDDPPKPYRFVLDVHLGTLAKALRMLGFDTLYEKHFTDAQIANIAHSENRIVLTRDVGLLKQKVIKYGYWLRSQRTEEQLQEVNSRYGLTGEFTPFMRCLCCNTPVSAVPKEQVLHRLPLKTRQYFNEFYLCAPCDKVYWKGSHYEHMQSVIQAIRNR